MSAFITSNALLVWWYHVYSPTPESPSAARHQLLFESQGTAERTMNKWSETAEWTMNKWSETSERTINKWSENAERTMNKWSETAERTINKWSETAEWTMNKWSETAERTMNKWSETSERAINKWSENAERTINKWSETAEWTMNKLSETAQRTTNKWSETAERTRTNDQRLWKGRWTIDQGRYNATLQPSDTSCRRLSSNAIGRGWKRRFVHRAHANCVMKKPPPSFPDSRSITCFNSRNSNRSCLGLHSAHSLMDPTTGSHDHWYRDKVPDSSRSLVPCNLQLLRSHSWAA